jgi:uncharacterized protein YyaL (SSP411 family)
MRHLALLIKDTTGWQSAPAVSIEHHLEAAARWLLQAQAATPDDGVAHSFDVRRTRWLPSYPETTGYVIPTLYDYARHFNAPRYAQAAHKMARWETAVQLEGGGVRAGTMEAHPAVPTIFNTGQVLFGWARAFRESGDVALLQSLVRAADWLVAAQDEDGAWRAHASPFAQGGIKSYNTRSAFGLIRAFEITQEPRHRAAAERNIAWALSRAEPNGFLPDNCLTPNPCPLTHTLAYSIRGILEVGQACGREDWLKHALSMARAIARTQRPDGALPGRLDARWQAAARWSCLTGNSQMAINWFRLSHLTGARELIWHAKRANRFNRNQQELNSRDPNRFGAIKGSHPIHGEYMPWRYPNWAAKFFMDALMFEHLEGRVENLG